MVARRGRPGADARLLARREPRGPARVALSRVVQRRGPLHALVPAWRVRMSNVVAFSAEQAARQRPDTPAAAYAELAVSTNFSFLRGASHAQELLKQAVLLGLAGIGIADRNSVAGVVRAYGAAEDLNEEIRKRNAECGSNVAELKLAVGARLCFADGTPDILAYPQNRTAWGRLTRLLTVGKSRGEKAECVLYLDDLIEHITGLNLIVMPPAVIKKDALVGLLINLKSAARRHVWLAVSMLYRGDDSRRLRR